MLLYCLKMLLDIYCSSSVLALGGKVVLSCNISVTMQICADNQHPMVKVSPKVALAQSHKNTAISVRLKVSLAESGRHAYRLRRKVHV